MTKVTFKEIEYKNFGKCLEIKNETVELVVTLDIGPRIIRYSFVGGENVFLEDIDRVISNSSDYIAEIYGTDAIWYLYGGHRFWVSPEGGYSYYPDNGPVAYRILENEKGASFSYGVQKVSGFELELVVTLDDNTSKVNIKHNLTNRSDRIQNCAPWALSVMDKDGFEIIPFNDNNTGLLHNRMIKLWPYTDMSDSRVIWGKKYIILAHNKNSKIPFKIGLDLQKEWVAYINKGLMFLKKMSSYSDNAYLGCKCFFETYTSSHFHEIESLGPMTALEPGASTNHCETWILTPNISFNNYESEIKIDEFVSKYIDPITTINHY